MFSFLEYANSTNQVAIVENNECFHNIKEFDRLKKPSKIILLLCDPTLRAYSDYKHIVRTYAYVSMLSKNCAYFKQIRLYDLYKKILFKISRSFQLCFLST